LGEADTRVVVHDVAPAEQAIEHTRCVGCLQIERQRALPTLARGEHRLHAPVRVAGEWFDLDHVGTELGEHQWLDWSRQISREVDAAYTVQQPGHRTDAGR